MPPSPCSSATAPRCSNVSSHLLACCALTRTLTLTLTLALALALTLTRAAAAHEAVCPRRAKRPVAA
eukprot:scaffold52724_cov18-Phaeocystis_antarctica.AAC.1